MRSLAEKLQSQTAVSFPAAKQRFAVGYGLTPEFQGGLCVDKLQTVLYQGVLLFDYRSNYKHLMF